MQIKIPIDLADRLTAAASRTNTSAEELADRYLAEGIEWHQASQPRRFVGWVDALGIARAKIHDPKMSLDQLVAYPASAVTVFGLRKVDHASEQGVPIGKIFEVIS